MDDALRPILVPLLYTGSTEIDIAEQDLAPLYALPADAVLPILQAIHLRDPDIYVRARAFRTMMSMQNIDKVPLLLDMLESLPVRRQANICYELGELRDPRAAPKLCAMLLTNPDPDVRSIAAVSLADIGDATAIPALEYAQAHDTGSDYEGVPIAHTARWALEELRREIDQL